MRTHGVVVPSPSLDHNLGLVERVEDLPVEQFVTQFSVEGFAVAILPGAARFDIGGLGSDGRNPFPKCRCHELWAVIGTDVRWNPRCMKRSASTSMTSVALSLRATRIARLSRVNSSITHNMRKA